MWWTVYGDPSKPADFQTAVGGFKVILQRKATYVFTISFPTPRGSQEDFRVIVYTRRTPHGGDCQHTLCWVKVKQATSAGEPRDSTWTYRARTRDTLLVTAWAPTATLSRAGQGETPVTPIRVGPASDFVSRLELDFRPASNTSANYQTEVLITR